MILRKTFREDSINELARLSVITLTVNLIELRTAAAALEFVCLENSQELHACLIM